MNSRPTKRRHTGLIRGQSTFTPTRLSDKKIEKTTQQMLAKSEENLQVSSVQFEKLKLAEWVCSILALAGFGCAAMAYDKTYTEDMYDDFDDEVALLLLLCSLSTFLLLVAIVWRTVRALNWGKSKGYHSNVDTLFTTGLYKQLIIELILNAIHPPLGSVEYYVDYQNTMNKITEEMGENVIYSYLSIISVLMIVRIYHLIRVVSVSSKYRNNRSQRLCHINGTSANTPYAIKCLVAESPYSVLVVSLLLGTFFFAYSMRVFERPISFASGQDFSDYSNCMWNIVITMTTVGYGDFFPTTNYGRVIGFAACIYGVMVVSLAVVTLSNLLELDASEDKSLLLLTRLKFKEDKKKGAAKLICTFLRYLVAIKKPNNEKNIDFLLNKYRKCLGDFYALKQKERSIYNPDSYEEKLERKLLEIVENFAFIEKAFGEIDAIVAEIE